VKPVSCACVSACTMEDPIPWRKSVKNLDSQESEFAKSKGKPYAGSDTLVEHVSFGIT
jgi:hypothetical protein